MEIHLFIYIIFSIISSFYLLELDEILKKLENHTDEGKMVYEKSHFIFDELNFTQLDIYSDEMKILYQKQENLFLKYHLSTYIFILNNIDSYTSIDIKTRSLFKNFVSIFPMESSNTIIALILINSNEVGLEGNPINTNYSDFYIQSIKYNLIKKLDKNQYYEGWIQLIYDLEYYFIKGKESNEKKEKEPYQRSENDSYKDNENNPYIGYVIIGGFIFVIFFFILCIVLSCKYGSSWGYFPIPVNYT